MEPIFRRCPSLLVNLGLLTGGLFVAFIAMITVVVGLGIWWCYPRTLAGSDAEKAIYDMTMIPSQPGSDCRYLRLHRDFYMQVHGKPQAVDEFLRQRRLDEMELIDMPVRRDILFGSPGWWIDAAGREKSLHFFADRHFQVWVTPDRSRCYVFRGSMGA